MADFASLGIRIDARDVKAANEALDKFTNASRNAEQASRANEAQSVRTNMSYERTISRLTESTSAYNRIVDASRGYTSAQIAAISAAERYAQTVRTTQSYQDAHNRTVQRANSIYADMVNRLTMTDAQYRNSQLSLRGLTSAQIAHINELQAERSAANEAATAQQRLAQQRQAANASFASRMSAGAQVNPYSNVISGGMSQSGAAAALIAGIERESELAISPVNRLTSSLSSLAFRYASIGAAIGIGKLMLDTVEQVQNLEVRLKGLTASAQDYANTESYLSSISKEHHKDVLEMSNSFARLLVIEQSGIITREQSKSILEGLSNAQSKTGASAADLKMSMVGMTQALSQGTLQWEEMKQVTDPIPGLMLKIANAAGYTGESAIGDFKKVVAAGQVTSQMFGEILPKAFDNYKGAAEAAGDNLTAKYGDIKNSWTELMKVLDQPVNGAVSPVLDAVSDTLDVITEKLGVVIAQYNKMEEIQARGMRPPNYVPPKPKGEENKAENDARLKEQEKLNALIEDEERQYTEIFIKYEQEQAKAVHEKNVKLKQESESEAKRLANEIESKAKQLEDSYKSSIYNIQKEIALRGDSSRSASLEYEMINGSLKDLSESKQLYLLQQASELDNYNLIKKGEEATKNAMDAEIMRYKELTLSARDLFVEKLRLAKVPEDQIPVISAKHDINLDIEAKNKSMEDAHSSLEKYHSELKSTNDSLKDLGATSVDIFDGAAGGISALTGALNAMVKSVNSNADAFSELSVKQKEVSAINLDKKSKTYLVDLKTQSDLQNKYAKDYDRLQQKSLNDSIDGIRQVASATAQMFEKNSTEAKAFNLIALGGLAAKAAAAVLTQGEGDPYTAFARIAAMAALVSGIVAAGGGGGFNFSGGSNVSPGPQGLSSDTGTILGGDSTTKSESIDKTYQLLKDIHADEYAELRGINAGIASLSTGISDVITRLFQAGGLATMAVPGAKIGQGLMGGLGQALTNIYLPNVSLLGSWADPLGAFLMNGIFGGKQTSKVTAQGISTGPTSLTDIMAGGNLGALQFANIETKTDGGWFGKDKYSQRTQYAALDDATQKALDGVFKSMGDTMFGLATELGHDTKQKVEAYIIPAMVIDLKDLSGEDAAKKLNGVISTALDTMSTSVFGDILGQYQQLGEGMLETAVRIVAGLVMVKDALATSGLGLGGDAIAISDYLVTAAGGLQEFQKQVESYYEKFFTDSEKASRLADRLGSQAIEIFSESDVATLAASRDGYKQVIGAMGEINDSNKEQYSWLIKNADAADDYYSYIEEAAEKAAQLAKQQRALDIQLMELQGNSMQALAERRKDELAAMDESLRGTQLAIYAADLAKKQRSLDIQLMESQGNSIGALTEKRKDELASIDESLRTTQIAIYAAQDLAKAQANLANTQKTAADQANKGIDEAMKRLSASVNAEKAALEEKYKIEQEAYNIQKQSSTDLLNTLTSVADKLRNALQSTVIETDELTRQRRLAAQDVLQSALNYAKAGNSLANFPRLEDALTDISKPSEQLFATFVDYQRDQSKTSAVITSLSKDVDSQLSVAQSTLKAIDEASTQAETQHKADLKAFDDILKNAQTQIDVLRGIDNSVLSLGDALRNFSSAKAYAGQTNAAIKNQPLQNQINAGVATTSAEGMVDLGQLGSFYQSSGGAYYTPADNTLHLTSGLTGTPEQARQILSDHLSVGDAASVYSAATAHGLSAQTLDILMGWDAGTSNGWASANNLPTFAVGINEVPYDMTANIHAGERIFPAADNKLLMQKLDNNDDNEEMRLLRQEVRDLNAALVSIAMSNNDMAKRIRKWDGEGTPDVRVVSE